MSELSEAATVAPVSAPTRPHRLPANAAEKAEWVKRFHESGLSLRRFSAQHPVSLMSICRWVNQARESQASPAVTQFEEVKLPPRKGNDWVAELILPNGAVLRLCKEVPAAMLDQLLRVC